MMKKMAFLRMMTALMMILSMVRMIVMAMSTCVTVSSGAYLTSRRITTDTGHEDSSP